MRRNFVTVVGLSLVGLVLAVLAAATACATDAPADNADITKPGTYDSGGWEYRLIVVGMNTKSRGTYGELCYAGKPVDPPVDINDYYHTPWGEVAWVGYPVMQWGEHGWMKRPSNSQVGHPLREPWIEWGGPVVMAMLLEDGEASDHDAQVGALPDAWVKEEMRKLGVASCRVRRPWFFLGDQAVTLHDSKMLGRLIVRTLPPRDADKLTILIDGSAIDRLDLQRKDGATALVVRHLRSSIASGDFYVAFRVEQAAPAYPRPLDIGPEAAGKEVVIKGTKDVIINLPSDRNSGLVWSVKTVQGDGLGLASLMAAGKPQFTPAIGPDVNLAERKGTFENALRVIGAGKSTVELELRRPWQTEGPAEKTITVTFDVQGATSAKP